MELVYLWVEEYKNIKRQGFNFSPRFECEFKNEYETDENGKEKLKDNCELIIKQKEHIEDFFGKNINVTAIIGKNGAGKSTIQKLIFLLIFLKKYQNTDLLTPENSQKENAIIKIFQDEKLKNKNIFLIINTSNGLKKISLLASINEYQQPEINKYKISTAECCLKDKPDELRSDEINFFSTHFNYMIDTWYDDFYDLWTNSIYHRADGYDTPLLLEPYKGHEEDNNYIDISNLEYLNNGKIFDFYAQIKENKHFNSFFNPNTIWMMIDSNKILTKYNKFDGFPLDENTKNVFENFVMDKVENKDLISLNKLYLAIKLISSKKEIFSDETLIQTIRDKLVNIKTNERFSEFIENFTFEDILKKTGLPETQKIEVCINFHENFTESTSQLEEYKEFLVLDKSAKKINNSNQVFDIFQQIPPWIYIEFYDKDKSYNSLSSGEKIFFSFTINMLYQIRNIEKLENYKTINLFLDEVESGLHPDWQKRFIKEVFYMLRKFKSKFNLFFATHSPFILSDLPKENVIFLENSKQVDVDINPFGANIHTLLSHGFFMKDGLMGEFAKNKIQSIIKYHKEILSKDLMKDKNRQIREKEKEIYIKEHQKNFWNIQSIIGDDYLKQVIKSNLVEIEKILYHDKYLDNEIERMKKELKKLEALKNA